MPPELGERRPARLQHGGNHPPEPEQLPCPRCESTNTKFCYYNNYNLSQPRHYCKSCRRYWTRGGTLRNVPVGGGTRKNTNKRSRSTTNTATSLSPSYNLNYDPVPSNPITHIPSFKTHMASSLSSDVNLNETVPETECYSSFLNPNGGGFFTLGGFGVGAGSVFREMGFGLGADIWHIEDAGVENGGPGGVSVSQAWQVGGVEGALSDGNCFGWPDLAISTPGEALK